jgi:hypothetical protein
VKVNYLPTTIDAKNKNFNYYYALPKHKLFLRFTIEKTEFVKGIYSDFANNLPVALDVIEENKVEYSIKNVAFATETVADNSEIYMISVPENIVASISYAKNLLPAQISISDAKLPNFSEMNFNFPADIAFAENNFNEIKSAFNKKLVKPDISAKEGAKILIERLNAIETNQENLLTSFYEVDYDGEAIKAILDRTDKEKEDIYRLFSGYKNVEYQVFTLEVIPSSDDLELPLARFSSNGNFVDVNDFGQLLKVQFSNLSDNSLNLPQESGTLAYKIPNTTAVTVSFADEIIFSKEIYLAQFCKTQFLPKVYGVFKFLD